MFGKRSAKKLPGTVATGLSLLQSGDRDGALRAFAEASHTSDPNVLRALGAAYQQAGEDGYAEHCLRLAGQGGSRDALNDLGVMLKRQNRVDEAEQAFRQASDLGCANASNNLGNIWEMRGDMQAAAWFWHRAAEGGVPRAMVSLGTFLAQTGQLADARAFYDRARAALPQAPDIRDQLDRLGTLLGVSASAGPGLGVPGAGGSGPATPGSGIPGPVTPGSGIPGSGTSGYGGPVGSGAQAGTQNDRFGPTGRYMPGESPAGGLAGAGFGGGALPVGTPPSGIPAGGSFTGGSAGDFGTGAIPDSDKLTRMDTALTRKRSMPPEEPPAGQPTADEYVPTMISRTVPGMRATGDNAAVASPGGDDAGGSSTAGDVDDIDAATVRNPRFRPQKETPSAPRGGPGGLPDETPVAEVAPAEMWDLGGRASQRGAPQGDAPQRSAPPGSAPQRGVSQGAPFQAGTATPGSATPDSATPGSSVSSGTFRRLPPAPAPAPEQARPRAAAAAAAAAAEAAATKAVPAAKPEAVSGPTAGSASFDPTRIQPTGGPLASGSWAAESQRELRGEEPPTGYYRRPTFTPAESAGPASSTQATGAQQIATPAAEHAAAAFDLSDNLRTVEKLRASYMDTRNATTLHLALEINKVGVESAPVDDPTAQALALSLRCTLLRLSYERDRDAAQLSEAIAAGRLAKTLFKPTDAGFPRALNSLATALQTEYGRAQNSAILGEALALYREAVRALPEGHPELAAMFSNIGNVLMTQGLAERSPELLDEAIHSAREAVGMSDPADAVAYATRQASLGMALVAHYANCDGAVAELDEAEGLFNAALAALPSSHPLRPQVQNYLAGISALRYS